MSVPSCAMSSVRIPQDARTEGAFSLRPVRDHTVTTIGALTHELHERCQVGGSSTCVWNDVIASLRRCAHCGTRSIAGRVGYPVPLQGLNGGYETSRPNVQQALNRMRSPAPSRNVRIDKCSGACGKSVPMLWPAAAVASRSGPLAASAAGREAGNITSYTFRIAAEKTGVCGSPRACYQCDRSMTGGPTWRKTTHGENSAVRSSESIPASCTCARASRRRVLRKRDDTTEGDVFKPEATCGHRGAPSVWTGTFDLRPSTLASEPPPMLKIYRCEIR